MNNVRKMIGTGLLGLGLACANGAMAECHDQVVYRDVPNHHHHVLGTAVGAVVGGVIGHQFGGGTGKVLTTAGGAVAGGAIGHSVAKHDDGYHRVRTVERVCTNG